VEQLALVENLQGMYMPIGELLEANGLNGLKIQHFNH
jgi:hypothetical protein